MDDLYSTNTALIYIFNLIVGTGALTLPKAFTEAGWILSSVLLIFLALFSYVTATFVIESISICSSIIQWDRVEQMKKVSREIQSATDVEDSSEDGSINASEDALMLPQAYIDNFPSEPHKLFSLDMKIEMSEMVTLLFNQIGKYLFYVCLCLYLYGDLTIFSAVIAKSLIDTTCTINGLNSTAADLCWDGYNFKRGTMYKLYLGLFLLLFGPYVFFNVQKTKHLQVLTSLSRWSAFALMIGLGIARVADRGEEHGIPVRANIFGLPALFGSSIYAFMCHHSLPGLIAPIKNKNFLYLHLAYDYLIILIVYLAMSLTAIFAFPKVLDLYTLNFAPHSHHNSPLNNFISYFLTLFPVFTLTTSFPIISVTLRGNLQGMFSSYPWRTLHKAIIPILSVVPPILMATTTENIETLVAITGSFTGVFIQYMIPSVIVMLARRQIPSALKNVANRHESPFKSIFWPAFILMWGSLCFIIVIINVSVDHKF